MKIGEAAAASGISERMIRHYEKIGLIPPSVRTHSGYRDYGPGDIAVLGFIARARGLGFSIDDTRQLIRLWQDRHRASADVKALALARAAELKRKERQLKEMRRSLEHLAARCHGDGRPDCPIIQGMESVDGRGGEAAMELMTSLAVERRSPCAHMPSP